MQMCLLGFNWACVGVRGRDRRDHTYFTDFHEILHGSALAPHESRGLHYLDVGGCGGREMGVVGVKWPLNGRSGREMGVIIPT